MSLPQRKPATSPSTLSGELAGRRGGREQHPLPQARAGHLPFTRRRREKSRSRTRRRSFTQVGAASRQSHCSSCGAAFVKPDEAASFPHLLQISDRKQTFPISLPGEKTKHICLSTHQHRHRKLKGSDTHTSPRSPSLLLPAVQLQPQQRLCKHHQSCPFNFAPG